MSVVTHLARSKVVRLFIAFLLVSVPLASCSHIYGLPTHGKVVEKGSNTPITDAYVIVQWTGSHSAIVESRTICVHVEATQSDDKGKYRTPFWRAHSRIEPAFLVQLETSASAPYAYKPGYEWIETNNGVITLAPSTKTPKERLEWLWWEFVGNSCHQAGKSQRSLFPLYKALYEEAKTVASESEEDQLTLYGMRVITASALFSEEYYQDAAVMDRLINEYLKDHLK